ncbi:DUF3164 family protein [Mesorhizobium sp. 1M-11]|uniref:DUF3164 family protein n=1 Tax=Mesorhizobium sp. 1M-11 TaxID=1529006 RepID=UPI0006C75D80|nr:DUF3164 family protein [Mesorhizobium sp. 1M-11]
METATEAATTDGVTIVAGQPCMRDAKGRWTPLELIKPQHKLEDETVRKIMGHARALSAQVGRFRGHTATDLGEFDAILDQEYGGRPRGAVKGNRTYQTIDGLMKVQVQVADLIDFGPELQIAKELIDECLNEWAVDAMPEIRAVVTRAFNTDRPGQINRADVFMLLRLDSQDARWKRAQDAIRDAMRVVGSKEYLRFYERDRPDARWRAVTIDLAKA